VNYEGGPPLVGSILTEIGQTESLLHVHKPLVRQMARELLRAGFHIYRLLDDVAIYLPGKIVWFAGDLRPVRLSIYESFEELRELFSTMGPEKIQALCVVYNKAFDRMGFSEERFDRHLFPAPALAERETIR
jgi:hypothetical protein